MQFKVFNFSHMQRRNDNKYLHMWFEGEQSCRDDKITVQPICNNELLTAQEVNIQSSVKGRRTNIEEGQRNGDDKITLLPSLKALVYCFVSIQFHTTHFL